MAVVTRHKLVAFGTFEVDLDVGEIRKAGMRIRLPGQPFRLLMALLARPGEVITREELQHEIWGANTNVDFERGIASAVNKLREALGDSADQPRYVETLARKGYRFIAPVRFIDAQEHGEPQPEHATLLERVAEEDISRTEGPVVVLQAVEPQRHAPSPSVAWQFAQRTLPFKLRRWLLLGCGVLALFLLAAFLYLFLGRHPEIPAPPHIEQLTQASNIYAGPPNP